MWFIVQVRKEVIDAVSILSYIANRIKEIRTDGAISNSFKEDYR